ncbi:transcriptional regulator [Psychromonas sp. psych-6C06]|uniref:FMN-binding negative transcriptional regulator n=1 Tax=Psychromonas sp. psych-6C06 TaxID=2058089 RepID=UPI000C34045E|nr:FMN-binding negative transcriptional regulator [Psychromonas sp. psych-6C06]PKF63281.1 transcriptional regulator [Psychromonas sp. psych-6C06]
MHIPNIFKQQDQKELQGIIAKYPFATLIIQTESGMEVDHLPFFLDSTNGKSVLQGHIAKANPWWKNVTETQTVMLVFHGPNCYISPNHYPTKKENGRAVPTWNYIAVHVSGTLTLRFDDHFKLNMLDNLTQQHEQEQQQPWSIKDAPEQYIQCMLPAIVGLEISITEITGKWKVSQNQPEINKNGVIGGLMKQQTENAVQIATLVKQMCQ